MYLRFMGFKVFDKSIIFVIVVVLKLIFNSSVDLVVFNMVFIFKNIF